MIYLDTETCGLHGPIVLLQCAEDDSPVHLYCPWLATVDKSIKLFEWIASQPIVGFNLAFDWFHVYQMWTVLRLLQESGYGDQILEDLLPQYVDLEPKGRDYPLCLKPTRCCDLMLHARKTEYQSTMDRGDVRIRRVPKALAQPLADELCDRVKLAPIYFARRANKNAPQWQVFDIEGDEEFQDVVLKFAPSSALKVLAADALGIPEEETLFFKDVELGLPPVEYGYAPFAKAAGPGAWPEVIKHHISHWAYNDLARKYAAKDVELTRRLYEHFGRPEPGDDDSELAACVACCRWRGYKIDLEKVRQLRDQTEQAKYKTVNGRRFDIPTAPNQASLYISEVLSPIERAVIQGSTKRVILEEIANWPGHAAATRAQEVLAARQADKEREQLDKLLKAGRFQASVKVIGALSGRMSGADGLNPQGIKKAKEVRSCFPLAPDGDVLCGGDFDSFEITLAEALYSDPDLRAELLSGKKIHGLFGTHVYPGMTYEEVLATSGTADDRYTRSKSAVFALLYGGTAETLRDRLGVPLDVAQRAIASWGRQFPGIARAQQAVNESFSALRQPGGIGSRVEWHEPDDYVESLFGFRRYFTLENQIIRALYELANKPTPELRAVNIRVKRRDREQTAVGAVQSALYGGAFQVQASNIRAATNHQIQSSGAQVTKAVQRAIWDLQPNGVHQWLVQPLNIHDEIMCPTHPSFTTHVKETVLKKVEEYRPTVPLIKMDWKIGLKSWAGK